MDLAYAAQTEGGDKGIAIWGHISIIRRISQRDGENVSIWAKTETCVQGIRAGMKSWDWRGMLQAANRQSLDDSGGIVGGTHSQGFKRDVQPSDSVRSSGMVGRKVGDNTTGRSGNETWGGHVDRDILRCTVYRQSSQPRGKRGKRLLGVKP